MEALRLTADTKNMINASLALFNTIKSIYETDYITIAKLMDQKVDQYVINQALINLED